MKLIFFLIFYFILPSKIEKYNRLNECNNHFFNNFNLEYKIIAGEPYNQICPNIVSSCCKPKSFIYLKNNWNNYLSVKFKNNYKILSNIFELSIEIMDLKIDKEYILFKINSYFKEIMKIRSKIYCFICDQGIYVDIFNLEENELIYKDNNFIINKNFCEYLVNKTIEPLYIYNNYYLKMINKFWNIDIKPDININNCYKQENKFFYCKKFCESYTFFNTNSIFDGNFKSLKLIFDKTKNWIWDKNKKEYLQRLENIDINNFNEYFNIYKVNNDKLFFKNKWSKLNGFKIDIFKEKNKYFNINFKFSKILIFYVFYKILIFK